MRRGLKIEALEVRKRKRKEMEKEKPMRREDSHLNCFLALLSSCQTLYQKCLEIPF